MKFLPNRDSLLIFYPCDRICRWVLNCKLSLGWLEPLLDRISRNPTTVVCPVIDSIDDTTLSYHYSKSGEIQVGGFNWRLVVSIFHRTTFS